MHTVPTTRTPGLCGRPDPPAGCPRLVRPAEPGIFTEARERMVREQLKPAGRDITHPGVLAAMAGFPRHELVPEAIRNLAYADGPLPISHNQTISQPYIVALMTQALDPRPTDRVLEIGTGSGYQAAILAQLVERVYTIEIIEPLAQRAKADLARLGCDNVFVRAGDGYRGWPAVAPFDAVIVTCAPGQVPEPLVAQLRDGGRMIIPVGPDGGVQELILLTRRDGTLGRQAILPVRFVPMTGAIRERI